MSQDMDERHGYWHVGHVRTTERDISAVVTPLLRAAVAAGERVVIVCAEPLADMLINGFHTADGVRVVPPAALNTRPAADVAAYTELIDRELPGDGRRLQLVTAMDEPAAGWRGWMQTEALLNHLLADRPVDHLCLLGLGDTPADERNPALDEVARATHPWLLTDAGVVPNPGYRAPAEVVADLQNAQLPDPLEAGEPALSLTDLDDMRLLRRSVHRVLAASFLSADAVEDFVLAIDEIVANAAEHGVPPVDVRLWYSRERMLCSITDRGNCFDDPLAGYGPAHGDMAVGGMGLWLARRSVDSLVAAPAGEPGEGCIVRLVLNT